MIPNWWHRRQRADVATVDERFTDFADRVSEAMGRWRTWWEPVRLSPSSPLFGLRATQNSARG
jgi:hypothetical protein